MLLRRQGGRAGVNLRLLYLHPTASAERILARRLLLVGLMLSLVALVFWFDRDNLRDAADNMVSFVDVVYFTMVTVTTVGYGDIVPVGERARLLDALFVTPVRILDLLDVPSAREAGYPDMEKIVGWTALMGPGKLPKAVISRWTDVFARLAKNRTGRRATPGSEASRRSARRPRPSTTSASSTNSTASWSPRSAYGSSGRLRFHTGPLPASSRVSQAT